MCGIAGIIGSQDQEAVNKMLAATRHRGPDDNGIFNDNQCTIGMNRLSILDLSAAGHQPMSSEDGRYWIVYNGEIYNFGEEREKLIGKGYQFKSHSDTEVLLYLFIEYGVNCLKCIRGMFAFVIWDSHEKKAFGARDHLGIKPFLYHTVDGKFVFCSELKGILRSGLVKKEINKTSLIQYLQNGYIIHPETIIEGVNSLLPGHYFEWQAGKIVEKCYWDLPSGQPAALPSYQEAVHGVKKLVIEAVNEELVSDVPVGVFLSGGLDSTVVVAAMKAAGKNDIDSFSVGFEQTGNVYDEKSEAEITAKHFGINHHEVVISGKEVENDFNKFIWGLDQPSVDGLNTFLVSKYAKKSVTVALSGLGGDELFSGYGIDRVLVKAQREEQLISGLIKSTQVLWKNLPLKKRIKTALEYFSAKTNLAEHYSYWGRSFSRQEIAGLLGTASSVFFDKGANYQGFNFFDQPELGEDLKRISRLHIKTFMSARLLRDSDAVSMIHSLEVRFPLIDHRLIEYVFPLPWDYKLEYQKGKPVLKNYEKESSYSDSRVKKLLFDAFKEELPQDFGSRPKRGFKIPIELWMKENLRNDINETFNSSFTYFPKNHLKKYYDLWCNNGVHYSKIWQLYIFEKWFKSINEEN